MSHYYYIDKLYESKSNFLVKLNKVGNHPSSHGIHSTKNYPTINTCTAKIVY